MAEVLRAAGLTVIEQPGWKGRGVELTGVDGIIGHHTACGPTGDCPSLSVVTNGRPDLAGPLCQLLLCRSGTFHAIADGKANHAGAGAWPGFRGNTDVLGIEAENQGNGTDVWPRAQMDAYARGVAAILAHVGLDESRFCAHYEWATPKGRKVDPRGPWQDGGDWWSGGSTVTTASANTFRARVKALLGEDDLYTDADRARDVKAAEDAAYNRHLMDDIIRPKLDAIFVDTHATDHPELLAGMVKELTDGTKPPK